MSLEAESDITSVPCSPQSLKRGKEKEESKGKRWDLKMKKQENRKKYREKKNKKGANAVEGNGTERKMMLGVRTAEGRGGEEGKTRTTKLSFVTQIPA